MNKIYINGRFLSQDITGVQRYALEVCKALKEKNIDFVILSPENINSIYFQYELPIKVIQGLKGHLWEQLVLPIFLYKNKINKIINFCNTAPLLFSGNLVFIHDLAFLRFPDNFSKKFLYFYKLLIPIIYKKSIKVFTVSEFSKKELDFFLGNKKITVIPCGLTPFNIVDNLEVDTHIPYFLAVSSMSPHKNFPFLISEFLKADIKGVKLKIVGGKNKVFSDHFGYLDSDRVEFLGRVSDKELSFLYSNALAFVFPSYYEGFGIPPLEAQLHHCPVISSNAASLPEVLGDSALYVDPFEQGNLSQKIKKLFSSKELRDKLIVQGDENIKRFDWSKSADILIKELEKLS